jgi:DinB family protein/pentapeptide repeat protein
MTAQHTRTDEFRGASFTEADLAGARFHDCDLSGVRVTGSWLTDVSLDGDIERLTVNGVDVASYVEAELDRRQPERAQARTARTAAELQAAWAAIEAMWAGTVTRAERLPEAARFERVGGEWSFAETLRHLVMATDKWASRAVLGEPSRFHPLGIANTSHPADDAAALGIDATARPSWAEVLAARASRQAVVTGILAGLTDAAAAEPSRLRPGPDYPEYTVGACLRVIMNEECEHHRFAIRDLAVLEAR